VLTAYKNNEADKSQGQKSYANEPSGKTRRRVVTLGYAEPTVAVRHPLDERSLKMITSNPAAAKTTAQTKRSLCQLPSF
jgi:hypothetical protein